MDQLIEMLIQVIIDLFRGSGKTTQAPPQIPPPRLPSRPVAKQPVPQRRSPAPTAQRPAPRPVQPQAARTAARQAPRPPQPAPVQRVAPVAPAPAAQTAAPSVKHPSVAVDAAALRRWLKPRVLRDQFILSEVFQPPIALRDTH